MKRSFEKVCSTILVVSTLLTAFLAAVYGVYMLFGVEMTIVYVCYNTLVIIWLALEISKTSLTDY